MLFQFLLTTESIFQFWIFNLSRDHLIQLSYGFIGGALLVVGTTLPSYGIIGLAEEEILRFKIFSHFESGYTEKREL